MADIAVSIRIPHRRLSGGELVRRILLYLVLVLGAVIMIFPFVWTIIPSISPEASLPVSPSLIPKDPSLSGYATLFATTPFAVVIANSLGLAIAATVLQLFTGSTAAYAFSRLPFRGGNIVFGIYLATMMIPLQVLIVPLFSEVKAFGLLDSYVGVLLPSIASAFGIFLLRQAISQVPRELDEAATLDGAGHFRIFW